MKYKVSVSGKEQLFSTREEVCDFLEIKPSTLYTLITGSTKLKASKLQKLMGIQVDKLDVYYHSKPNPDKSSSVKTIDDYKNKLIKKLSINH